MCRFGAKGKNMSVLKTFVPRKDFLLCVDSDGSVMDTMEIKHKRCFGPCMVDEWNLSNWQKPILKRWNDINLYTMTRGINRFRGLALALGEIHKKYTFIEGVDELNAWVGTAQELSNQAVEAEYNRTGLAIFRKALNWSEAANRAIAALPQDDKQPFVCAFEGLSVARSFADVAVISSANRDAVEKEWKLCGLRDYADIMLCQDTGSKARCIAELLKKGYAPKHVLMVGDAPVDKMAAERNGVFYYPILARYENDSWEELISEAIPRLREGLYAPYGERKTRQFLDNLNI